MIYNTDIKGEERLVLFLSNPHLSENHKNDLKSILLNNRDINPETIYSLALANGVAGFVFKNSHAPAIFPDKINLNLHNVYRQTAFRNVLMLRETLAVLKLLSDNNIAAIPLKGAAASDLLFNDFGVYPSGDIDILVHPPKLSECKKVLCDLGSFSQINEIAEQDLLSNHYHLIFRRKNMLLEVHWNLVKRYFSIPADFWWQESKEFKWNGINTFELSIERYILYNIFRLFDHCFNPLRFFILLNGIIEQNADHIDWGRLIEFASHHKMEKLVVLTLKLVKDMFDTNIPENLIQTKYFGYKYFKLLVLSGIFSGIQKQHLRMMFYVALLIESKTIFKILGRRIFPSKGELRLRYNIPSQSNKIYLYYILNPFFLLFKKTNT